jgi:hypothetical protein
MFAVVKHLAPEISGRLKARLVADGRDQNTELYLNKALPNKLSAFGTEVSRSKTSAN